jgi:hypothetical protein
MNAWWPGPGSFPSISFWAAWVGTSVNCLANGLIRSTPPLSRLPPGHDLEIWRPHGLADSFNVSNRAGHQNSAPSKVGFAHCSTNADSRFVIRSRCLKLLTALSKGWASKATWVMLFATAMGGRIDGKEQGTAQTGTDLNHWRRPILETRLSVREQVAFVHRNCVSCCAEAGWAEAGLPFRPVQRIGVQPCELIRRRPSRHELRKNCVRFLQ